MLNLQEMKEQSHKYIESGFLNTPIYSPHDILALIKRLESAEWALHLYADKQSWDQEIFLCASAKMREDLEETDHSRFTPGARAREHFKKYPCEK